MPTVEKTVDVGRPPRPPSQSAQRGDASGGGGDGGPREAPYFPGDPAPRRSAAAPINAASRRSPSPTPSAATSAAASRRRRLSVASVHSRGDAVTDRGFGSFVVVQHVENIDRTPPIGAAAPVQPRKASEEPRLGVEEGNEVKIGGSVEWNDYEEIERLRAASQVCVDFFSTFPICIATSHSPVLRPARPIPADARGCLAAAEWQGEAARLCRLGEDDEHRVHLQPPGVRADGRLARAL